MGLVEPPVVAPLLFCVFSNELAKALHPTPHEGAMAVLQLPDLQEEKTVHLLWPPGPSLARSPGQVHQQLHLAKQEVVSDQAHSYEIESLAVQPPIAMALLMWQVVFCSLLQLVEHSHPLLPQQVSRYLMKWVLQALSLASFVKPPQTLQKLAWLLGLERRRLVLQKLCLPSKLSVRPALLMWLPVMCLAPVMSAVLPLEPGRP